MEENLAKKKSLVLHIPMTLVVKCILQTIAYFINVGIMFWAK